ncbi:MmgE/PrpD family protein [Nocardia sp. CDC159]|uniref:MmgE/PrpD family protein n=1 Tax=Nocardia pulmonis TaxID=2951408 RepID=A0A9X2EA44_9NOCA|nr:MULTISPECIES: MmgE/PrpD family protein [Nocardia]MCM6777117.1 MmgE/PrpD family protein [Nocardia pulmonis]MCM6790002.1 MmgE/PrpD family protein [Nocardia sp. CDC159]
MTLSVEAIGRAVGSTAELATWARTVRYENIPATTLALARSQLISTLATVRASLSHPLGRALVATFGAPLRGEPKQSAAALAGLATCLDFDDVSFVGHLSASCATVPVAYARPLGMDGRELLTTIVVANECAARLTAATILGPFFRAQANTHCHLVGAATALLHARRAPAIEWASALGLALGMVPTPLHRAVLGSDLKPLTAALPVRSALDACDAAAHGMRCTTELLDGGDGLLAQLSAVPLPDLLVAGLGRRWHTDTVGFKRFPGSAYAQAAYECAERLSARLHERELSSIRRIVVHGCLLTYLLDRKVRPFLDGRRTPVAAANFALGYGLATILLTGRLGPEDLGPGALDDERRWRLADKVSVEHDTALTEQMLRATAPLGEALRWAGPRAATWPELQAWAGEELPRRLAELGLPEATFEQATMSIGARVVIELADGRRLTEQCDRPIGMTGPATRQHHQVIAGAKFLGVGGGAETLSRLERIETLDHEQTVRTLAVALCQPCAR